MVAPAQKTWIDGQLLDGAQQVSLLTHTLHYGVGAFEGIRSYRRADGKGYIFRLKEHILRLYNSCKLVLITPRPTIDEVCQGCVDVLFTSGMMEAYLRPLVYLGDGSMGLLPDNNPAVTAITAWEWGAYLGTDALSAGIRCKVSAFSRPAANTAFPHGKLVGQYVTSVVAKQEARSAGYDEALLLDPQGFVSEGSGENLFVVRNGELVTPPSASSILPGITRDTIMTLAREQGLTVREERFGRDYLYLADEVFLTGTAAELTPVREIDDRQIGSGKVGPISRQLQDRYFDVVRGSDDSHPEWLTLLE